jgi:hypothetical protein
VVLAVNIKKRLIAVELLLPTAGVRERQGMTARLRRAISPAKVLVTFGALLAGGFGSNARSRRTLIEPSFLLVGAPRRPRLPMPNRVGLGPFPSAANEERSFRKTGWIVGLI